MKKRGSQWREGDKREKICAKKEKQQLKDEGEGGEGARGSGSKNRKDEEVEKQRPHMRAKCSGSQKEKQGKCLQTAE